jgi:mRNA interferase RelE/StbE
VRRNSVRYEIRVVASAHKQLDKLSADVKERILRSLFNLEKEPRPANSKKLKGHRGEYRLRIGDYRVIYEIDDGNKVLIVLKCMHRGEIYR